jgi:hypothetical protein
LIQQPTDAIMRMNSLAAYGWHLHLHDVPDLYLKPDNILGHQPMGIVEQMIAQISHSNPATASSSHRNLPRTLTPLTSCYPVLRLSQPTNQSDPGGRDSCSRPAKAA